jgi:hypothetical protein
LGCCSYVQLHMQPRTLGAGESTLLAVPDNLLADNPAADRRAWQLVLDARSMTEHVHVLLGMYM